jgi:membrane associated rhomboid family serine protease
MIPIRDENPTSRRAVVTLTLILVNVAIYFFVQFPKDNSEQAKFTYRWAGVPCELDQGEPLSAPEIVRQECTRFGTVDDSGRDPNVPVFPDKNIWFAVFASMFLHASVFHLLGNMLFLWIFGNNVEDQLGPLPYLLFYLAGGIAASAAHVLGNLHSTDPFVGASGAIAAVMGAYIVWFPRARIVTLVPILLFFALRLPAVVVLGLWFVLQFVTQSESHVATLAHIGGFVFGMLIAWILKRSLGMPRLAPVYDY